METARKRTIGTSLPEGTNGPPVQAICGAKNRQGDPCRRAPVPGRTRCRNHGGASPRGIAHPRTRHGRYSADIPTRLAGTYAEARADPDRLALHAEISLVDARLADALSRVESGESGERWRRARALSRRLQRARTRDPERAPAILAELDETLTSTDDRAAWREVMSLIDQRARLVRAEATRMLQARQYATVEELMTFLGAITIAVERHVADPVARAGVAADLSRLAEGYRPRASGM